MNVESSSRSKSGLVVVSRSANTCAKVIPAVGRGLLAPPVPPSEPDTTTRRPLSHPQIQVWCAPTCGKAASTWFVDEGGLR